MASTSQVSQDVETGRTPLQVPDVGAQDINQPTANNSTKEGGGRLLSFIRILRLHSFIISLFALFLLLNIRFILYHAPLHAYFGLYETKRATTVLAAWMFAGIILTSLAACITVFRRKVSVGSNIIAIVIDIVLAAGIIASAVLFTHEYPHSLWCDSYIGGGRNEAPHPECWNWKNLAWILMKMSFTLAIILSVILVILIVCHIIAICHARPAGLQSAYAKSKGILNHLGSRVPFTLKVNISFERKSDNVVQTSEAPLGQGPVHL